MARKRKKTSGSFSGYYYSTQYFSTPQTFSTTQAFGTSQPSSTSQALDTSEDEAPVTSPEISEMASKRFPPILFDKFANSEIFTIRAGADLQSFRLHKDLLAGLSDEMHNHVYNEMKEGQENSMDLKHIPPDIMRRFMEFCYSGDYLHALSIDNPLVGKEAVEALPLLLTHARLYVLAEMYNINSLKELSRNKIIALVRSFGNLEDRAHGLAMISLMEYVLDNIPPATETPDKLVAFLASYAGFLIEKIGEYPEFHGLLVNSPREDFFRVLFRRVKAGGDKAPWADLE